MAVRNYTIRKTANPLVYVVEWLGLTTGDTGQPFDVSTVPGAGGGDRSVQVGGTVDTATVSIEGSNDGTNFLALADPQGTPLEDLTPPFLEQILEYTRMIRPAVGGTGGNLNFYLIVKGAR